MDVIIQISNNETELNQDQLDVIRRITNVLQEHKLLVKVFRNIILKSQKT